MSCGEPEGELFYYRPVNVLLKASGASKDLGILQNYIRELFRVPDHCRDVADGAMEMSFLNVKIASCKVLTDGESNMPVKITR